MLKFTLACVKLKFFLLVDFNSSIVLGLMQRVAYFLFIKFEAQKNIISLITVTPNYVF